MAMTSINASPHSLASAAAFTNPGDKDKLRL